MKRQAAFSKVDNKIIFLIIKSETSSQYSSDRSKLIYIDSQELKSLNQVKYNMKYVLRSGVCSIYYFPGLKLE